MIKFYYHGIVAFSRQKLDVQPISSVGATPHQDTLSFVCSSIRSVRMFFCISVHWFVVRAFRLLFFRFFVRPAIGLSVRFFVGRSVRPSVLRCVRSYVPLFDLCPSFLSILRPYIRCFVRPASIRLRSRLLGVNLSGPFSRP